MIFGDRTLAKLSPVKVVYRMARGHWGVDILDREVALIFHKLLGRRYRFAFIPRHKFFILKALGVYFELWKQDDYGEKIDNLRAEWISRDFKRWERTIDNKQLEAIEYKEIEE